jgi:hypothetical protein
MIQENLFRLPKQNRWVAALKEKWNSYFFDLLNGKCPC